MTYQLYRQFNCDGALLYVGIAKSALKRQGQHGRSAPWAKAVARVEIKDYSTRESVMRAERWAIGAEAPLFNKRHCTGLMSNLEVGQAVRFTLAEAYEFAAKGELFSTIWPAEFASMSEAQRRHHRRMLKRAAHQVRKV